MNPAGASLERTWTEPSPPPQPSAEEAALLARLRAGEEEAFRELVAAQGPRLLGTARRFLRNDEDAQDAVQEALLSALKALERFDGRSKLATWLHRIVVNACLMRLRSRHGRELEDVDRLQPVFAGKGAFAEPQAAWPEVGHALAQEELADQVRGAIARLPECYREPLVLRHLEDLSNQEVADVLGITVNAAKVRLHRAHNALRALLEPRVHELVS